MSKKKPVVPPGRLWPNMPISGAPVDISIIGATGEYRSGKAQPLDAKVLTPTGWSTIGKLKLGDKVVNPEGGSSTVIGVYPQGQKKVFRIEFSDGASTLCCDEHLWFVQDCNNRNRGQDGKVISLHEIRTPKLKRRWIPLVSLVQFDKSTEELPIDPYVLGVIIGDGCITHGLALSNPDVELLQKFESRIPSSLSLVEKSGNSGKDWYITSGIRGGNDRDTNELLTSLRKIGLHGKKSIAKFIPENYLRSTQWDRIQLLNGLCDTDGTASPGWCEYSTSSPVLSKQVRELVWSLGGTCNVTSRIPKFTYKGEVRQGERSYRVYIRMPEGMNPFSLSRKADIYSLPSRRPEPTRRIKSVTPAGETECQCILLDSDNHLYVTDDYIVTHNSLLGLTIAPGVHPEGHKFAGKPRTRVYDVEKSTSTYQGTGADIINVIDEVQKFCVDPNTKTTRIPTDVDIYLWLVKSIEKIEPGQFDVVMIDPWTDFESGMTTYIRQNPGKFSLTANQITSGGGLIWGVLKSYMKIMLSSLASRCQTFYFTAHLRDEFLGAIPTGKREPKGKDTLMELASIYLWLERKPDKDGNFPEKPSAIVLKERLSDTVMDNETGEVQIIKLIPPRIPEATAQSIREYIANPPDYGKLKEGEKYIEQPLTEDEKLALKALTATKEAEASSNSLAALDYQAKVLAMQAKIAAQAPQSSDRSHETQTAAEAKREANATEAMTTSTPEFEKKEEHSASEAASTNGCADPAELKKLQLLLNNIKWPDEEGKDTKDWIKELLIRFGVPQEDGVVKPRLMSPDMCAKLIDLTKKKLLKQGADPEAILLGK